MTAKSNPKSEPIDLLDFDLDVIESFVQHFHFGCMVLRIEDIKDLNSIRILHCNEATASATGVHPKEANGKYLKDIYPGMYEHHFDVIEKYREVVLNHTTYNFGDFTYFGDNAPMKVYKFSAHPFKGNTFYILYEDVTIDRKMQKQITKLNQRLERSNEELKRYAYVASHDLQHPLRLASSYLQLAKNDRNSSFSAETIRYFDRILLANERMTTLVNDLLEYSDIERSKVNFSKIDVHELISEVKSIIKENASDKEFKIDFKGDQEFVADQKLFVKLLSELCHNSIKFSRSRDIPEVNISISHDEEFVNLEVQDNGIGFENDYKNIVFQLYTKLHSRDRYEGNGIGLALCKKIVELHDGEIEINSELNHGTKVLIKIPKTIHLTYDN